MVNRTHLCPFLCQAHEMTESKRERLKGMEKISRNFNMDLRGVSEGEKIMIEKKQ